MRLGREGQNKPSPIKKASIEQRYGISGKSMQLEITILNEKNDLRKKQIPYVLISFFEHQNFAYIHKIKSFI